HGADAGRTDDGHRVWLSVSVRRSAQRVDVLDSADAGVRESGEEARVLGQERRGARRAVPAFVDTESPGDAMRVVLVDAPVGVRTGVDVPAVRAAAPSRD